MPCEGGAVVGDRGEGASLIQGCAALHAAPRRPHPRQPRGGNAGQAQAEHGGLGSAAPPSASRS
jgi:hypothetical protein